MFQITLSSSFIFLYYLLFYFKLFSFSLPPPVLIFLITHKHSWSSLILYRSNPRRYLAYPFLFHLWCIFRSVSSARLEQTSPQILLTITICLRLFLEYCSRVSFSIDSMYDHSTLGFIEYTIDKLLIPRFHDKVVQDREH